jgi:nicotinamidase-related amidase
MPLTQLDPMAALVVIDLQKGILAVPNVSDVIARNAELTRAFREHRLPVVLVNVTGMPPGRTQAPRPSLSSLPPDWSDLLPALAPAATDILITKQCWGAYIGTTLHDQLRQRGVTQIVLTGVATSIGVESTARSAYEHGYNVVLVTDAMTDRDPVCHQHSIDKIFPRLGETATAAEVMSRLQRPS